MNSALKTTHLKDYLPPAYLVDQVEFHFDLEPARTEVQAVLHLRLNPESRQTNNELRLDGRNLELLALSIDGRPLGAAAYTQDDEGLSISDVPEEFVLQTRVRINPESNTALEGLYRSSGIFCTQCEAQGFRKITFYPDRPDVMATYRVTLTADRNSAPVLLSNGNLIDSGKLENNRHYATFEDPFPKPSYLFALVAGPLTVVEDSFETCSGRAIKLQIFVEERNRYKCAHAMCSLQKAMRWDEEVFGLEYDLDEYKVVAVDDFNMGAMENKGLNVFNSKYVLAQPDTATDADYQGVEGVIGHEYFHNWTGNRVTCRDWFQLSLKEGLTVFRDQEFSADMGSRAVKRISDVRLLRNVQFPEDAGPMAHPVRPESYIEINNFYTSTVYNKGAEVVRMYQTLLGVEGFKRGLALYFERHDGQAVTTDDFLAAMADANAYDFEQFRLWYCQAGTPVLDVAGEYDSAAGEFRLRVVQSCPQRPGESSNKPFLIPLGIGLLGTDGADLPLQLADETAAIGTSRILNVCQAEQTFCFVGVTQPPVPSLLRGFSAPVRVNYNYTAEELAFLFAHDCDEFNRWEAGQRLATSVLLEMTACVQQGSESEPPTLFVAAFRSALTDVAADPALLALALTLPSEIEVAAAMTIADPGAVHAARQGLRKLLATSLSDELSVVMKAMLDQGGYTLSQQAIGRRSLKNLCLGYLSLLDASEWSAVCFEQFAETDNMTDRIAALACLVHNQLPHSETALAAFYHQYQDDPLVVDKWFSLQATSSQSDVLDQVLSLMQHPAFTIRNPNRVRALVGAFAQGNPAAFHQLSGAGYRFLTDQVLALDALNPQMAARMVSPLSRWRRYDEKRRQLMQAQLEKIQAQEGLSRDVGEIVAKSLAVNTNKG